MPAEWSSYNGALVAVACVMVGLFVILLIFALVQQRHSQPLQGKHEFNQKKALVVEELSPEGYVRLQGEIWLARSSGNETIPIGSKVRVIDQEEMELLVEPW